MAGMRALGRLYDVVPAGAAATGVVVCLKDCSGVGVAAVAGATATGTLTFTAGKTYNSSGTGYVAVSPANGFGQPPAWYQRTANTAAWTAETAAWSGTNGNTLTIDGTTGGISYVDFLVSELADGYDYLYVVPGAAVTITMLLYDLTVQREPQRLRIPSA